VYGQPPRAGTGPRDVDDDGRRRQPSFGALGPLYQHDRLRLEGFLEPEFLQLFGALQPIQVDVVHGRYARVAMPEYKGRAGRAGISVKSAHERARERGLPRAEVSAKRDDVARMQRRREAPGSFFEPWKVCRSDVDRDHRKETRLQNAKYADQMLRANDVLVGVITGAIVALIAAGIESFLIAMRFMSFGAHGGGFGSGMGIIMIVGAVAGGLIGLILGAFIKPRTTPR
jgi:hypothetical protein